MPRIAFGPCVPGLVPVLLPALMPVLLPVLLNGALAAQSVKLNLPFPFDGAGQVREVALTADGRTAVFLADQEKDELVRLYAAPTSGAGPVRALDRFVPAGDVLELALTPDGHTAVYVADHDADEVFELWSVPVSGGAAPVKLSGPMAAGGDVAPLSPDFPTFDARGGRVAYRADQEADEVFELFGAPLDGSAAAVRLNAPLAPGARVISLALTPDGAHVLFTIGIEGVGQVELFGAPSDGSAPAVRLHEAFVAGGNVLSFSPTGDGSRVVYLADAEQDERFELYSAPVDGSAAPVRLNRTLVPGGDVARFVLTPDGARAVFAADDLVNDEFRLLSAPCDGSAAARLLSRATDGDAVILDSPTSHGTLLVGSDSRLVVYAAQRSGSPPELYGVLADGTRASRRLSTPPPSGSGVRLLEVEIGPDCTWVVYRAERPVMNRLQLFLVPSDASTPAQAILPAGAGNAFLCRFARGGRELVLGAELTPSSPLELYAVPVALDRPLRRLNGPLVPGGRIPFNAFEVTPDGARVVYRSFQDSISDFELFASDVTPERNPAAPAARRR